MEVQTQSKSSAARQNAERPHRRLCLPLRHEHRADRGLRAASPQRLPALPDVAVAKGIGYACSEPGQQRDQGRHRESTV